MDEGVLVQLDDEEEEHIELEQLAGVGHRLDDFAYDDDDSEDEELMNEGSFLLSDTRRGIQLNY